MGWQPVLDVHFGLAGALSLSRREKCKSLQKWIHLVGESGKGDFKISK